MLSREQILKVMREKVTHPATPRELTAALKVPQEERATFRRLLKSLVTTGELVQTKGGRIGLPDKMDLVVGRQHTHAARVGFVLPGNSRGEQAAQVVSRATIQVAMHGVGGGAGLVQRNVE
jgi:ribonuclease R